MKKHKKPLIVRGAGPVRDVLGPAFDMIPKAVFALAAYRLACPEGVEDLAEVDIAAKRRLFELWEEFDPLGLPLPRPGDREALLGPDAGGQ